VNTARTHFTDNSVPRRYSTANGFTTLRGVRQDNPQPPPASLATPQPAPLQTQRSADTLNSKTQRTQNSRTSKKSAVKVTSWVKPVIKQEIEKLARSEGLSISAISASLLEKALQQSLYIRYAALIDPIIEKAIGKHMRSYSNRVAVLLVRSLFASEQARSYAINILGRLPGMTDTELNDIKHGASNTARANITRVTPQMKTLIEAVQTWLEDVEKGGTDNV